MEKKWKTFQKGVYDSKEKKNKYDKNRKNLSHTWHDFHFSSFLANSAPVHSVLRNILALGKQKKTYALKKRPH